MVRFKGVFLSLLLLLFGSTTVFALPSLCDWGFNINNVTYEFLEGDSPPLELDQSVFNWDTGLGTLSIEFTAATAMDYSIIAFFDHEIDEMDNTFFNEFGTAIGTPDAAQSWEIDEPGYFDGDIYDNLLDGTLDNTVGTSIYGDTTFPDDVSMALGWDLSLLEGDILNIDFLISETVPTSGFYLEQNDPDSDYSIYFSSTATVTPVPEPATILLLGAGLVGFIVGRKYFA